MLIPYIQYYLSQETQKLVPTLVELKSKEVEEEYKMSMKGLEESKKVIAYKFPEK